MVSDIFSNSFSPLKQVFFCLLLGWVGMLSCHFLFPGSAYEFAAAFTAIILFTIINLVVSIFSLSFLRYTWPSWGLFLVLLALLLLSSRLLSGISIWSLFEYRMMLMSIVIFYVVASILVRIVRAVWEFAEEDEN